jgi:hypothetical protein
MADIQTPNEKAASRKDDAGSVLVGRPTVAANNGADLHNKALKAFIASDLSMAEWLRLPAPRSRCRLTQMSRTTLNEAIERGDVRAITVRQSGATRGIKLINRASLLAWLARLDAEQNATPKEGGAS